MPKDRKGLELRCAVEVLGLPLPSGSASLTGDPRPWAGTDVFGMERPCPGPAERRLAPVTGGALRFSGLAPGNYILEVSPLGLLSPMPLSYKGLSADAACCRLTLCADGAVRIYDRGGRLLCRRRRPLLSWNKYPPEQGTATFRGTVQFPKGPVIDLDKAPILLMATVIRPGTDGSAYCFHRLCGKVGAGGKKHFGMPVPPGRLWDLRSWSGKWALRPQLRHYDSAAPMRPGRTTAMRFEAKKGVSLNGSVSIPGAGDLSADSGLRPEARAACFVTVRSGNDWRQHVSTGADGKFSVKNVFPGIYAVAASYERNGAILSSDMKSGQLIWLGRSRTLNMRFPGWTDLRAGIGARLPEDVHGRSQVNILGYLGGLAGPRGISPLDICSTGFCLRRGHGGSWEHHDIAAPDGLLWKENFHPPPPGTAYARIHSGRYDIFTTHLVFDAPFCSIRVLSAAREVVIGGACRRLRFDVPRLPSGNAVLCGSFGLCRPPGIGTLRRAGSPRELGALCLPQADLYNARGGYIGSAYASIARPLITGMLDVEHQSQLDKEFARPLAFRMNGLPAGAYTVRVFAHCRRPGVFSVTLEDGKMTYLDAGPVCASRHGRAHRDPRGKAG